MIKVSDISNYLKKKYIGKNILIKKPVTFNNIKKNSVAFLNKPNKEINICKDALILIPKGFNTNGFNCSFIEVEDPRLSFARVINKFFLLKKKKKNVHKSCYIGKNCKIKKSVSVGINCVIGNNVTIGANTIINNNVVISDNVIIGDSCYIKSGSTIGDDGFGFAIVKNKAPFKIPQIGSVVIGSNVEIGANSNVARGSLDNTIIENDVKIDDQVHIAHNCYISKNTVIAAGANFSGSVKIGKNCWIGLGCSIIQKVVVGDNSIIGMGAIVTKNVKKNSTIAGFNSIELKRLAIVKDKIKYGK